MPDSSPIRSPPSSYGRETQAASWWRPKGPLVSGQRVFSVGCTDLSEIGAHCAHGLDDRNASRPESMTPTLRSSRPDGGAHRPRPRRPDGVTLADQRHDLISSSNADGHWREGKQRRRPQGPPKTESSTPSALCATRLREFDRGIRSEFSSPTLPMF